MAERQLKWTLDVESGILTCKHKESQTKQQFTIVDFYVNIDWSEMDNAEKHGLAYSIQQKLSDGVAGKGKKAGYSGSEVFAIMRNKWDALTIERTWNQKSGERMSPQKKLSKMEVVSQSMVNAAPLIGLVIPKGAKVLSDADYAIWLEEQKEKE